jgi:hypothetical protein
VVLTGASLAVPAYLPRQRAKSHPLLQLVRFALTRGVFGAVCHWQWPWPCRATAYYMRPQGNWPSAQSMSASLQKLPFPKWRDGPSSDMDVVKGAANSHRPQRRYPRGETAKLFFKEPQVTPLRTSSVSARLRSSDRKARSVRRRHRLPGRYREKVWARPSRGFKVHRCDFAWPLYCDEGHARAFRYATVGS